MKSHDPECLCRIFHAQVHASVSCLLAPVQSLPQPSLQLLDRMRVLASPARGTLTPGVHEQAREQRETLAASWALERSLFGIAAVAVVASEQLFAERLVNVLSLLEAHGSRAIELVDRDAG